MTAPEDSTAPLESAMQWCRRVLGDTPTFDVHEELVAWGQQQREAGRQEVRASDILDVDDIPTALTEPQDGAQ